MTLFSERHGYTREGREVLKYLNRRRGKAVRQESIAQDLKISRRTVSRCVADLQSADLICVDRTVTPHVFHKGGAA